MAYYNHTFADGKWNHFMDQVHIGYTIWQDPPQNVMPRVTRIELPDAAAMGVAVEGSASAWPGAMADPVLPRFDAFNQQRHYIDVFNRGQASFDFTATASDPWIVLSAAKGTIAKEERLWVTVDWPKAPAGSSQRHSEARAEWGRERQCEGRVVQSAASGRLIARRLCRGRGLRLHRSRALHEEHPRRTGSLGEDR